MVHTCRFEEDVLYLLILVYNLEGLYHFFQYQVPPRYSRMLVAFCVRASPALKVRLTLEYAPIAAYF